MHIVWNNGGTSNAPCPACGNGGVKATRLAVRSALPPFPDLPLAVCGECGTHFFPTLTPPEYETAHAEEDALAFYLEQGAGVDVMAESLFAVDPKSVRRYLEVGCGFGFSLDFARAVFGWTVRGVDPGFAAAAGRRLLDLDILPTYLRTPADAGDEPRQLTLCSEVVEHIFEPVAFLELLRGVLDTDGVLLLTTPNAGAIAPDTSMGTLVPLLSPGYHVNLYSADGLARLLRRAGFTSVEVIERGPTLRAAASTGKLAVDLSRPIDRRRYLTYLEERSRTVPGDTPLGLGLRYRRLKEFTHTGDFAAAGDAAREVKDIVGARWGINLDDPKSVLGTEFPSGDIKAYHARAPFCLCGILYCLGIAALLRDDDKKKARTLFLAAAEAGEASRAALQSAGADDGETDDLTWRSRGHAARLLAWDSPAEAVEEIERLANTPGPRLGERIPPAVLLDTRDDLFVTLVNLGHHDQADALAAEIEEDVASPAIPAARYASTAFTLGIHNLNFRKAPETAARWFEKSHTRALEVAERSPASVEGVLWPALYHQAHALSDAGRKKEATVLLRRLLNHPDAKRLPPLSTSLRARATLLAATARLGL